MTNRISKSLFAALLLVLLAPVAAMAQVTHWVQIEAHATLRTAEEFARRYEERVGDIAGFRIAGGWYALAAGPYATPEDAEIRRLQLLAAREIRADAYVTDNRIYGQQFWPVGGQAETQTPLTVDRENGQVSVVVEPSAEVAEVAGTVADPTSQANADAVVDTAVETAADTMTDAGANAGADATTEAQQTVADTTVPAVVEPVVEAVVEPEPEPVVDTLPDARTFEYSLNRDDRVSIQTALQWFGFYRSGIDAQFGPGTRAAIRDWQNSQGLEPWGILSRNQMMTLLAAYDDAVARYGFGPFRDDAAGIEMTLPLGMVEFERHEAPFAHLREINDSGMRVLLISQEGSQSTLFGLYEILQTLEVIPLDGERDRGRDRFIITGQSATQRAHVEARLQGGMIKGWILLWDPSADDDAELIVSTMRDSFRSINGVLPSSLGATASTVARRDLIAGLEVRRPEHSRSGFFVDAVGTVVTSAEAVQGCERVTIDEAYRADVRLVDNDLGIALLTPQDPLVPLAFAQFSPNAPGVNSDVRVSGFSYQDTLTRPIITFGQLSALEGLDGETHLNRLSLSAEPGDSGGPVFDGNGTVIGMLLPRPETPGRMLPEDVNFSVSSASILSALQGAGLTGTQSRIAIPMSAEILTRVSADLTVLVSCWK